MNCDAERSAVIVGKTCCVDRQAHSENHNVSTRNCVIFAEHRTVTVAHVSKPPAVHDTANDTVAVERKTITTVEWRGKCQDI